MNMPHSQTNYPKNEVVPVPAQGEVVSVQAPPKGTGIGRSKVKLILRWVLTCLPLGGIAWASFLPLQTWMQQALILVTLIWFYAFFLLDTFFLGG
jgi:hypothetical protein